MVSMVVGVCHTNAQPLCYFRWNASQPRGVIQIKHGLGDHAQRYSYLAEKLAEAGYTVFAADHIGHGMTGHMNGDFGKLPVGAHGKVLHGFEMMTQLAHSEYPTLPLIFIDRPLMGKFSRATILPPHRCHNTRTGAYRH